MKFFIDNNLGKQLSDGMKGFGESVTHLQNVFPEAEDDPIWLPYVGKHDLFLITRDDRIRWRPAELAALRDNHVGAFFLGGKNRNRCKLIQQLVRNRPQMKRLALGDAASICIPHTSLREKNHLTAR